VRFVCTGLVNPERADVSFDVVSMTLQGGDTASVSCKASQVSVLLDAPSLDGWISAFIVAESVASIIVNSLGFALGSGYSIDMRQVVEADGTPHVFGVRPTGERPGDSLAIEPSLLTFKRAIRLSGHDLFFRLAVQDYLRAMTDVTDCATYCYRAIEGIKSAIVFRTGNDSWDEMHSLLGTDRTSITEVVKRFADPVRHGNWVNAPVTTSLQRWMMLSQTRDILVRYLNYAAPAA